MGQDPTLTTRLDAAATALRQNRTAEAERLFRAVLQTDPANAAAHTGLGLLYRRSGHLPLAVRHLQAAAHSAPNNPTYQDNLAIVLMDDNRIEDALVPLRNAYAARPNDLASLHRLTGALRTCGRYVEATTLLRAAVDGDSVLQRQCRNTGAMLREEDKSRTTVENCRHVLARYPAFAPAHYTMACELEKLGEIEEACRASERALSCNPTAPAYYRILLNNGNPAQKKAASATLAQLAACENQLLIDERYVLHFLLAKQYQDAANPAAAFPHLQQANALKRSTIVYDEAAALRRMQDRVKVFSAPIAPVPSPAISPPQRPVFVVGMPRAGTTLVEQILASHPDVYGAGEIDTLPVLMADIFGPDTPDAVPAAADLARLASRYRQDMAARAPDAACVVDKYLLNFQHLGWIHAAMPDACIVHVMRTPVDTCFSCYEQLFAGPLDFAYDLAELGRYYRAYEKVMAHWRTVLPAGAMLEIAYEDVVADLEGQARALIAFCGLAWDDRCLSFHKTKRAVVTASLAQVRRPIYRNAVGRAQAYAPWLEPLYASLKQDMP